MKPVNKVILNADIIPAGKREAVERVVLGYFQEPEEINILYQNEGITRALLALPLGMLDQMTHARLKTGLDEESAITDGAVNVFNAIDFDIAKVLEKSE